MAKPKIGLKILSLFLVSTMFFQIAHAQSGITGRTGAIKITKPDGTVLTVPKDKLIPYIPSGAVVEVLDGSMNIEPVEGFIRVIVRDIVAIVKVGDRAVAFIDQKTGMAGFRVESGTIRAMAGNTAALIGEGREALVGLDKRTGVAQIESVKDVIETVTAGVKVYIPEGSVAEINADPETRIVHVESQRGIIRVMSLDGKVTSVGEGEPVDMPASPAGEIQTFPGEEAEAPMSLPEEPAEPERPEGSPYTPS